MLFVLGMDVVGMKEDCHAEYIRELLLTQLPAMQLAYAIQILRRDSEQVLCESVRMTCVGAYILLRQDPDPLYHKLKAPVTRTNRHYGRDERDQLLGLLSRLDPQAIAAQVGERALAGNEATAPARSIAPHLATGASCTSSDAVTTDSAARTPTPALPPLYDTHECLNAPYAELLNRCGVNMWAIHIYNERPVEVWTQVPEAELKEKMRADNPKLAERLIRFMGYKQTGGPAVVQDLGLTSGSLFQELDYQFSRTHVPLPFVQWTAAMGSVGVFLEMSHPKLGHATLMLTFAHVVFKQLTDATDDQIDAFNEAFDYAHYDRRHSSHNKEDNSLDFCILEVPKNQLHAVANIVPIGELRNFSLRPIPAKGSRIFKFGWATGLTSGGIFASHNSDVDGRNFTVILEDEPNLFAKEGDSGSALLYDDPETRTLVPLAIMKGTSRDPVLGRVHCGCNIVQILQKYVAKRTSAAELPSPGDVIETFKPCGPDMEYKPLA